MQSDTQYSPSAAVQLALQFYRDPAALRAWLDVADELPDGMAELLRLAAARDDTLEGVAGHYQAEAGEVAEAAQFFLQQVLLESGASHYRVLGLARGATADQVRKHHRLLMRLLHPDRHIGRECWTDGYATRVNEAYNVLRRADSRERYDRDLPEIAPGPRDGTSARPSPRAAVDDPYDGADAVYWRPADEIRRSRSSKRAWPLWSRLKVLLPALILLVVMLSVLVLRDGPDAPPGPESWGSGSGGTSAEDAPPTPDRPRPGGGNRPGIAEPGEPGGPLVGPGEQHTVATPIVSEQVMDPLPADRGERSLAVIPASRDTAGSVAGHGRTALVIPPSRKVVPPPRKAAEVTEVDAVTVTAASDTKRRQQPAPRPTEQVDARAAHVRTWPASAEARPAVTSERPAGSASDGVASRWEPPVVVDAHPPAAGKSASQADGEPLPRVRDKARPAMSLPQRSVEDDYSEVALMSVLGHLVESYQQGDLVAFVGLFSATAVTTDEVGRNAIEAGYRQLFANSRARSIEVSAVSWRVRHAEARGEGRMVLHIWRDGEVRPERYEGRFSVGISRERQQLVINRLLYRLERS